MIIRRERCILNNNTNNNIYGAVIASQSHCESSPGSCDEYGTCADYRGSGDLLAAEIPQVMKFNFPVAISLYFWDLSDIVRVPDIGQWAALQDLPSTTC